MSRHEEEREKHEKERGFRVVDKRRFTAEGESKNDAPAEAPKSEPVRAPEARPTEPRAAEPSREGSRDPRNARQQEPQKAPEYGIDFLSFCASLATNALAAMGALPEAEARGLPKSPELAREYIDILAMLQDKTRGNLSRQEEQALAQLLAELRLQFVELTRRR